MPKRKQNAHHRSRRAAVAKRSASADAPILLRLWTLLPVILLVALSFSAYIPVTSRVASSQTGYVLGDEEKNGEFQYQQEGKKQELQIETAVGQKIRIKTEDAGKTKIEKERGPLPMKQVAEASKAPKKSVISRPDEDEDEEKKGSEDLDESEDELEDDELEDDEIEVATRGAKHSIRQRGIIATTDFPLSVNPTTKALTIDTPAGKKTVTTLPDQAVDNLLKKNIIQTVNTASDPATPGWKIASEEEKEVELVVRENTLQYKVKGVKKHRLFGFIPVSTNMTVFVSAQSGEPTTQQQSALASLIDFLSL